MLCYTHCASTWGLLQSQIPTGFLFSSRAPNFQRGSYPMCHCTWAHRAKACVALHHRIQSIAMDSCDESLLLYLLLFRIPSRLLAPTCLTSSLPLKFLNWMMTTTLLYTQCQRHPFQVFLRTIMACLSFSVVKERMFVSKMLDVLVSSCLYWLGWDLSREIAAASRKLRNSELTKRIDSTLIRVPWSFFSLFVIWRGSSPEELPCFGTSMEVFPGIHSCPPSHSKVGLPFESGMQ